MISAGKKKIEISKKPIDIKSFRIPVNEQITYKEVAEKVNRWPESGTKITGNTFKREQLQS